MSSRPITHPVLSTWYDCLENEQDSRRNARESRIVAGHLCWLALILLMGEAGLN